MFLLFPAFSVCLHSRALPEVLTWKISMQSKRWRLYTYLSSTALQRQLLSGPKGSMPQSPWITLLDLVPIYWATTKEEELAQMLSQCFQGFFQCTPKQYRFVSPCISNNPTLFLHFYIFTSSSAKLWPCSLCWDKRLQNVPFLGTPLTAPHSLGLHRNVSTARGLPSIISLFSINWKRYLGRGIKKRHISPE